MSNTETKKANNGLTEKWAYSILLENPILLEKIKKLPLDDTNDPKELFVEVIKFMHLVSVYDMKLSPSLIVDLGWHEFILFTKAYQQFCNQHLGRFIHHTPDNNEASNNKSYLKTIQCYIKLFGKPLKLYWGEISQEEWSDTQCGSCKSN